jgi:hypothetical protein
MNLLFTDFESYYDSRTFTLKKVSMLEYIKSPEFKVHGVGVAFDDGKVAWITGVTVAQYFRTLDWSKITVVAHNAKFDGGILSWVYGVKPAGYICTQSMARAVFGDGVKSHSLANIAAKFGLEPKGFMQTDGVRDLTPQQEEELALYCKHDVELCREIYNRMAPKFPDAQLRDLSWTIKAFTDPTLRLNADVLKRAYDDEKLRRENIFTTIGIPKEVFSSNVRFPALLKERGFDAPYKISKKTGKEIPALALGDPDFLEMRDSENEELAGLCEARIAAKSTLLETRADKFLRLSKLGPFPFDVNYSGAKRTHRYSGGAGAGGNPQNLPRNGALREAVEAPVGHKLVVGDFAGIELRIVAWLANETKLMYAITNNQDVYSEFASRYYGRPITKADKLERQFGKCAILGLGYGMGATRFVYMVRIQTGMRIDEADAKRAVDLYRMHYWHVPRLWEALNDRIPMLASGESFTLPNATFLRGRNGEIILPSGLTLKYPNLRKIFTGQRQEWVFDAYEKNNLVERKLYGGKLLENISQALAGEICKVGIQRCEAAGLRAAGQVHDEVIAVVPESEATMARLKMQQAMEAPMQWWPYLRLKAEIGVGDNWKGAK